MRKHWFSLLHPTNFAAIRAIKADGVNCSVMQVHKLLGKSGRVAGNPLHRKARAEAAPRTAASYVVYFVRRGARGPIKIGKAIDVENRMSQLQNGNAEHLVLLGMIPGGDEKEREMHKRFAAYRMKGEWFRCAGELAEFVKTLKQS